MTHPGIASPASLAGEVTLGDITVRRFGFGTMRLVGRDGAWPEDVDGAVRVLRDAVDLGVTFFDTADIYGPQIAEELVAKALWPYDGLLVATKGGFVPDFSRGIPLPADGRPESLRAACEASLRRLRVERIDLYQLHTPDPQVPITESIGALAELQREGKIRHIGVSNVGRRDLAALDGLADIVSVQNRYGVGDRRADGVVDWCTERGVAFLPWGPIQAGTPVAGALTGVAAQLDATSAQVALAWLLQRSPTILPIPGTSRAAHLRENVAAAGLRLSEAQVAELDAAAHAAAADTAR